MFISEKVIFLELQKTACSHVLKLLQAIPSLKGHVVGKHNLLSSVPAQELGDLSAKLKLGTIRNPWDWYVSLWAFGCLGRGGLFGRIARPQTLGRKMKGFFDRAHRQRHQEEWQAVYDPAARPEAFRKWLSMLFDPDYRLDLGERFGDAPVSRFAGLLTHRYLTLFTRDYLRDVAGLHSWNHLAAYADAQVILDQVIRSEHLDEDFHVAMRRIRVSPEEVKTALAKNRGKTNASQRGPHQQYYDDAARALVADREQYLIRKFDYQF